MKPVRFALLTVLLATACGPAPSTPSRLAASVTHDIVHTVWGEATPAGREVAVKNVDVVHETFANLAYCRESYALEGYLWVRPSRDRIFDLTLVDKDHPGDAEPAALDRVGRDDATGYDVYRYRLASPRWSVEGCGRTVRGPVHAELYARLTRGGQTFYSNAGAPGEFFVVDYTAE